MKRFRITFNNKEHTVNYITDRREAGLVAKKLASSVVPTFGIDIETYKKTDYEKAGLDPHTTGISLMQIYDGQEVYVFDAMEVGLGWLEHLKQKAFVAHYGIFEIKHLTHNGFPDLKIGCSMLLSILVDRAERSPFIPDDEDEDEEEPSTWKGYGLDAIIGRLFNLRVDKKWQTYTWGTRPLEKEPLTYAALDAILTYDIAKVQVPKIIEYKMQKHYHVLEKMQHVIAEMEISGVKIDDVKHGKLIKEWVKKERLQSKECEKYFGKLNLNSTMQLGAWAADHYTKEEIDKWPTTKKGKLGFGKSALAAMQHLPEIGALLKYKKTAKLLSTYGESLKGQTNPITHRVHCSFSLGETRTGRLSSRDPNLQNLPRDSAMRDIFVAEKGNRLIVADFNQVELRVAGEVSKDPVIRGAYARGDDLHTIFASTMFSVPVSRVTKDQRQIAKSANFGAIYGMGANKFITYTLSSTDGAVKLTYDEAKHTIDSLWALYSVYGAWCKKIRLEAEATGFVRTPLGKMRKLAPEETYTKAPNTVVQGGAFEVMALSMIHLKDNFTHLKLPARIINSVHDEIIVEVHGYQAEKTKLLVEDAMCYGMKKIFPRAPLKGLAKAVICESWSEGKA